MTRPEFLRLWLLSTAGALALAIPAGLTLGGLFTQSDGQHYLDLAAGRPVMLPFASRQLEPLIVRALPLSAQHGFVLLGVLALIVFVGTVSFLTLQAPTPSKRWMLLATLPLFFWAHEFNGLVLPDLFYAALVCGLLLLLWRRRFFGAALMLFPLAVARESTILLLLCLLIACWRAFDWRHRSLAILATAAGFLVVKHLTSNALANQEHISPALYMAAKMPWNFLKNFLGLSPWANVYPACETPVWQHALHVGPLRAVGSCGFEPRLPVRLAGYALASFGLLPLLLWQARPRWSGANPMVRFALIYGMVSFLIAGLLGDSVERLFGYAWPAFLVAWPMLWPDAVDLALSWNGRGILGLHLFLSWAAYWSGGRALLLIGAVIYFVAFLLMRKVIPEANGDSPERQRRT